MPWTHPTYEAVAQLLGTRTGLSFSTHRQDSVEQQLAVFAARIALTDPRPVEHEVIAVAGQTAREHPVVETEQADHPVGH